MVANLAQANSLLPTMTIPGVSNRHPVLDEMILEEDENADHQTNQNIEKSQ